MWPFKKTVTDLFSGVPGPSPWYLRPQDSPLPGYKWEEAGKPEASAGKRYLSNKQGTFLIVDFYHYVLPISETLLFIWNQGRVEKAIATPPVKLTLLDITKLSPFKDNLDSLCAKMKNNKIGLMYEGSAVAEIELDILTIAEPISFSFPEPVSKIDELLILCHSSAIGPSDGWEKQNLALLVAHPAKSVYQLYPQDWFNNGSYDFSYQWPTRMARNSKTGKIHGEGIRLDSFILDDSLKNLK